MNTHTKSTIGQAIDQAMAALIQLEKREQQIVVSTLCSLLDLVPNTGGVGLLGQGSGSSASTNRDGTAATDATELNVNGSTRTSAASGGSDAHELDIRTLRNQKQPASAQQMACLAAYYLQEHAPSDERTKEVTTSDLERLFKQAGFKLPSRMQQVLIDGKSAGYFESVDRGKYKLTRVGYNLVTHSLPKASAT